MIWPQFVVVVGGGGGGGGGGPLHSTPLHSTPLSHSLTQTPVMFCPVRVLAPRWHHAGRSVMVHFVTSEWYTPHLIVTHFEHSFLMFAKALGPTGWDTKLNHQKHFNMC